jgi:hypothetical protein
MRSLVTAGFVIYINYEDHVYLNFTLYKLMFLITGKCYQL